MDNLWRDEEARGLSDLDRLVYRSRLIGRETALVLTGGGNTSLKHDEVDFRGRTIAVMRVKGSGADLATIGPGDFPAIRLDDVAHLREREAMSDEEVVEYLAHCLVEPGSRRPSIEALLHAFVPHPHVDHTHADAILGLTNTSGGRRHVESVFGEEVVWIPYRRPGFALSRQVGDACRKNPLARAAVLEKHGLITWGRTAQESYDATIEMNTRAEQYARERRGGRAVFGKAVRPPLPPAERRRVVARIAPFVRGLLARRNGAAPSRVVLRFDDADDILEFVGSEAAAQVCLAGPATPDHLLYTRPRPLFVNDPILDDLARPEAIAGLKRAIGRGLERTLAWYGVYFRKHTTGGEEKADPAPRVVLIPRIGMLTAWRDAARSAMVGEIYHHTVRVMGAAQGLGEYRSLSLQDAFDVEYWPLELYRMSLGEPAKELASRVAVVTGAAGAIGGGICRALAAAGCHVVVTDRDAEGARALARDIEQRHGAGRALGLSMDVTREESVIEAFEATVLAYGGVDIVVSNAGAAHSCPIDRMSRDDWQRSLDVNATGHFLVSREALRILKEQGLGGAVVFVASKNVLAPGKDFGAYSAAKAAQTQLARVLAIEAGEHGIRVNLVNPDAVFEGSGLWSPEVRGERARAHGIRPDDLEEFYRRRNLLGVRVRAEDVAEAVLWLASERSSRTTGCILTIDGGVREAFPR